MKTNLGKFAGFPCNQFGGQEPGSPGEVGLQGAPLLTLPHPGGGVRPQPVWGGLQVWLV